MHYKGVRSIAVALMLVMLLGFSEVDGAIWGGFFKGAARALKNPAFKEGRNFAAHEVFSRWVEKEAPESDRELAPSQSNPQEDLTTDALNSLEELVVTIKSNATQSTEICDAVLNKADQDIDASDESDILSCAFILCSLQDERDASSVGQDCFLTMLVFGFYIDKEGYNNTFCSETNSSDCKFYGCVMTQLKLNNNVDMDKYKSVGTGCYASSYTSRRLTSNGSGPSSAPSATSGAAPAVSLHSSALTSAFVVCVSLALVLMV